MTRKALGRGLGALLSAERPSSFGDEQNEIELDLIDASPLQPRTYFEQTSLDQLAQSIETHGVVQPIVLRRKNGRYELVAGERRWRAAKIAGLERIPAVVRDVQDKDLLELALIENIQREDLNPIEEAQAYKKLIEAVGLTQESLAERVGRDRSYITNYLRLLRLPEDLQRLVAEGRLSTGHARTLLGLDHVDEQRRLARRIIERGLSVRETEALVRRLTQGATKERASKKRVDDNDANVRAAEAKLRRRYATQVRIIGSGGGGGKIEIAFYSPADLERVFDLMMSRNSQL
ncbi:MAG TPA: ParB/RepB/Spo0J family partition protein [Pyrinomonadaceae bacterium]|nr:ParB/RepB/Spo0J family partition protein [Pyrinomonadaceae bacterium]